MFDGKSIHYQQAIIQNDGFWPDIDAGDFEKSRSIPAVTSHETVLTALLCAVTEINTELAARREYWKEQGHIRAVDIPGSTVLQPEPRNTDAQPERMQNHITALYTRLCMHAQRPIFAGICQRGAARGAVINRSQREPPDVAG
ncbi:head completion/stabilization protein [Escherichia coli]|nr:head completion/stabilization protein [Escherichia coli]